MNTISGTMVLILQHGSIDLWLDTNTKDLEFNTINTILNTTTSVDKGFFPFDMVF